MRAVSGTRWGANETSLLTIYKMLIRSILDYGAAAYDSASISQLRKLDKIQYSALKLCFGAIKSTAASALQVDLRAVKTYAVYSSEAWIMENEQLDKLGKAMKMQTKCVFVCDFN